MMGDQIDMIRKSKPILHDPNIIPRVKQYLEENVHKTYVDVSDMARVLQERYRGEYGRRKMAPFRQLVEQAYKTVLHSYGLDSNPSSDDNDESDIELMDDRSGGNHVSNMLTDMYLKATPKKPFVNEVAINISSDESDDDADMVSQKTSERSEKATHPTTTTNVNQVTITKVANLPPAPARSTPGNNQHQQKKRKMRSPSISPVQNSDSQTTEKSKRQSNSTPASIPSKTARKFKREFTVQQSKLNFDDIGGMKKVLQELCELLMHIKHPEVYRHIGLPPPRGFLLHGPPGSGKTLLAQAIAGQLRIGLIQVAATELVAGVSGESEERIRELFEQAVALSPCVLFIDEIDAISSNRLNAQKDMERRIVAQLLSCMDGLSQHENGDQVLIIGATNRPDALDPALRRVGRFDQEISLGIPDRNDRANILQVICRRLTIGLPFDYDQLGALTPGYVGADLLALASRAATIAVKRAFTVKQQETLTNEAIVDRLLSDINRMPITNEAAKSDSKVNGVSNKEELDFIDPWTNGTCPIDITDVNNEKVVEESKEKEVIDVELATEKETDLQQKVEAVLESNEKEDSTNKTAPEESSAMQVDEQVEQNTDKFVAEDDDIIEVIDECNDAFNSGKLIHSQQTFDAMKSWLSDDKPIMSADEMDDLCITMIDFTDALKVVQPSAKREGFITVPDVTWDDIGSLRDIREELQLAILAPVKFPKKLQALGLNSPSGVLLCGPPGCGKTLLAKAVANEAGINFISVKGPELLNMYVGESERAVRQCFQRARNSAPCVIFFDEFDSLCPKRSDSGENNGSSRLVNQLLTEMDGIEDRKGVFLMAATNRPDIVDPAVMRPGRLDKILYVGLPGLTDRVEILRAITKVKPALSDDVDIIELASHTDSYTGADLAGLVRQASLYALKESISSSTPASQISVSKDNFMEALKNSKSSISEQDKRHYEKLRKIYTVVQEH